MPRAEYDPLEAIHLEKQKLAGRFGARVEVDAAAFLMTGNLTGFDDGVELRRLRLVAGGDGFSLVPFSYKIEVGYVPNKFNLQQAYLLFGNIGYAGSLQVGQFQPPMGLEVVTSSWDIPLMEPAAPLRPWRPASAPASRRASPSTASGRPSARCLGRGGVPASTATPRVVTASPWAVSRACPSTRPRRTVLPRPGCSMSD